MLLADRGFANHELMGWLRTSRWHYCLRLPSDVLIHGARRYPTTVTKLYPMMGEAMFYKVVRWGKLPPATHRRHVGLWLDGHYRCNLVLASPQGVKEPWAVITDELPTLQTLWQYALRNRSRRAIFG